MNQFTMKRYDKDCYQIFDGDNLVGFALRMANDTWRAFDPNHVRIDGCLATKRPKNILDWFNAN
jgi:hypothetical protein